MGRRTQCLIGAAASIFSMGVSAITTLECNFSSYSDEEGNNKARFPLTFIIDKKSDKAYLLGNNGTSEVLMVDKGYGLTFVEITETGNVMTTTLTDNLKAVHSRNTVVVDRLVPSQYYGACTQK